VSGIILSNLFAFCLLPFKVNPSLQIYDYFYSHATILQEK